MRFFISIFVTILFSVSGLCSSDEGLTYLDPESLDSSYSYFISKKTPVMSTHTFSGDRSDLGKRRILHSGSYFKILSRVKKRNTVWYKVRTFNKDNSFTGTGWINSIALLGQNLTKEKI